MWVAAGSTGNERAGFGTTVGIQRVALVNCAFWHNRNDRCFRGNIFRHLNSSTYAVLRMLASWSPEDSQELQWRIFVTSGSTRLALKRTAAKQFWRRLVSWAPVDLQVLQQWHPVWHHGSDCAFVECVMHQVLQKRKDWTCHDPWFTMVNNVEQMCASHRSFFACASGYPCHS